MRNIIKDFQLICFALRTLIPFEYNLISPNYNITYLDMFTCMVCYLVVVHLYSCKINNIDVFLLFWIVVTYKSLCFCSAVVGFQIFAIYFAQLSLPVVTLSYFNSLLSNNVLSFMCLTTQYIYMYYVCIILHLFAITCIYNLFLVRYLNLMAIFELPMLYKKY